MDLSALGRMKKRTDRPFRCVTEEELLGLPPQLELWLDDDSLEKEWEE